MGVTHSVGAKEGWVTADLCGLSEAQCGDQLDPFPMPRVDVLIDNLAGANYLPLWT